MVIAGVLRVPHFGVADQRQIRLQRLGVGGEEGGQGDRAGLLLALEQHRHVARQAAMGAEGAAGLEEGHQLAFVVAGAARDDPLTARPVGEARFERRGGPQGQRIGRLDVVMAVEQHARRVAGLRLGRADDHRPAGGVLAGGLEAEFGEFPRQPVGGARAIGKMGRNGRDRGDRQQGEQAVERLALVGVDGRKHVFERGHETPRRADPAPTAGGDRRVLLAGRRRASNWRAAAQAAPGSEECGGR